MVDGYEINDLEINIQGNKGKSRPFSRYPGDRCIGCRIFAGLKVTQPAMLKTAQRYFDKTALYDYRLISTVGFSEDEVETIKKQKDVKAAEGAVTFDIICESGGKERVLKMHSITEDVNRLVLVDGELPENAGECVVDSNLYGVSMIGKTIKLSDGNDEDDLEHFSNREYKITGIVQSPLYSQFERGSTSLGNGRVSGFVYLCRKDLQTIIIRKFM